MRHDNVAGRPSEGDNKALAILFSAFKKFNIKSLLEKFIVYNNSGFYLTPSLRTGKLANIVG
jgi:hypothetical protein